MYLQILKIGMLFLYRKKGVQKVCQSSNKKNKNKKKYGLPLQLYISAKLFVCFFYHKTFFYPLILFTNPLKTSPVGKLQFLSHICQTIICVLKSRSKRVNLRVSGSGRPGDLGLNRLEALVEPDRNPSRGLSDVRLECRVRESQAGGGAFQPEAASPVTKAYL